MKLSVVSVFVIYSVLINVTKCAKILGYIPTPSISHQTPFRSLFHELARRGHQVTLITTDPAFPKGKAPKNLTEIDFHDLSYDLWTKGLVKYFTGKQEDTFTAVRAICFMISDILDQQFQTKEMQSIVHGKDEYDLIITESWVTGLLALTQRFKAPVIQISTLPGTYELQRMYGVPTHPILYPQFTAHKIYNLTILEKINEIYNYYKLNSINYEAEDRQLEVMRKYFDNVPTADELKNRADMIFINMHPIFQGNIPVPPSVQYVWGIHKKQGNELLQDLKSYLDSSKRGVIYVSFGSNADPANFPPGIIQIFTKVFSQLPYDILFKWSKDELPGKPRNVKIGKWFPQPELLKHPKVKLFITQGGLQSTDEAITAGVPLVGLPMLADQWFNVEKYVHFGIGERLDVEDITEDQFKNTIEKVIGSDSYRKNIEKLRDLMKDEPQPPLERAVWWVEYVLRHGGARHLRSPAANITRAQFYEIELLSVLIIGLIIALSVLSYAVYFVYSLVTKNLFRVKLKKQ